MGTLTINTAAAEDTRIATAFGARLGLSGSATQAQVKAAVVQYIKDVVLGYEQGVAAASVQPIAPT